MLISSWPTFRRNLRQSSSELTQESTTTGYSPALKYNFSLFLACILTAKCKAGKAGVEKELLFDTRLETTEAPGCSVKGRRSKQAPMKNN
jgi:hypothetical protein